jgi:hypothetical protein
LRQGDDVRGRWVQVLVTISWLLFPVVLFEFGLDVYSTSNKMLGVAIYVACSFPVLMLYRTGYTVMMLVLVMANYIVFFVVPLFHESLLRLFYGPIVPKENLIDKTLTIVLLAVCFIQLGFYAARVVFKTFSIPRLELRTDPTRLFYLALVCILSSIFFIFLQNVPPSLIKLYAIVFSSDLGIAILSLLFYGKKLGGSQKLIALLALIGVAGIGFSSGSTQLAVQPLAIWYLGKWITTARIPFAPVVMCCVIVIVLQPVKSEYRDEVWYGGDDIGVLDSGLRYISLVEDHWLGSNDDVDLGTTSRRMSLLLQTSHVVNLTPRHIPFQGGDSLLYTIYGLIPRIFWEGKPIAQKINIWFAGAYQITTKSALKKARFGIGHPGEAYISYGMIGVPVIFFLLGVLYYLPIHMLTYTARGGNRGHATIFSMSSDLKNIDPGLKAIFLVVLVQNMIIGSSIGNVFGAVIQQLVAQFLIIKLVAGTGVWRTRTRRVAFGQ